MFLIFGQNNSFLEPFHHFRSDQMRPMHHSLVWDAPMLITLGWSLPSRYLSPPSSHSVSPSTPDLLAR